MDKPRQHLFTGAGRAIDKYRYIGCRDTIGQCHKLATGRISNRNMIFIKQQSCSHLEAVVLRRWLGFSAGRHRNADQFAIHFLRHMKLSISVTVDDHQFFRPHGSGHLDNGCHPALFLGKIGTA